MVGCCGKKYSVSVFFFLYPQWQVCGIVSPLWPFLGAEKDVWSYMDDEIPHSHSTSFWFVLVKVLQHFVSFLLYMWGQTKRKTIFSWTKSGFKLSVCACVCVCVLLNVPDYSSCMAPHLLQTDCSQQKKDILWVWIIVLTILKSTDISYRHSRWGNFSLHRYTGMLFCSW